MKLVVLVFVAAMASLAADQCSSVAGVETPGVLTVKMASTRTLTVNEEKLKIANFSSDVQMCGGFMVVKHTPEGRTNPVVRVIPSTNIQAADFEPDMK